MTSPLSRFNGARWFRFLLFSCMSSSLPFDAASSSTNYCKIEVRDKESGWPVPLVEFRTVHNVRFVSDNAGVIALDLPDLWGQPTWFEVQGQGYECEKDGFGYRGVRLTPSPGKTIPVQVTRKILARRLGRITGAGLLCESQKLGLERDWKDTGVLGCDSVQLAVFKGKLYWAWGDTLLPGYPLGLFDMSSAVTDVDVLKSLRPPLKIDFRYLRDDKGQPRSVAKLPGSGPTWLSAYTSLKDANGQEHLVATYAKIKPPMEAYERGLCVWNDQTRNFERLKVLWTNSPGTPKPPPYPDGHPALCSENGRDWAYFGNPFPNLRCPATFEAWCDSTGYESLSPQAEVVSASDGKPVKPHSGSIAWSDFRKKWVTIFMQTFGAPSAFGEIWYAEAPHPTGPWGKAVKILSHENYTFYNPRIHEEVRPAKTPVLLFEGTYTADFADKPQVTPRYNYNQVLYRLDLDDPALAPAWE